MWFPVLPAELHYLLLGISTILLGIFVDLVLGIAEAIKKKDFSWMIVVSFLETNILPYVIVWGLFSSIPVAMIYWRFSKLLTVPLATFSTVAFAFIIGELADSIWAHVKAIGFEVKEDEPEPYSEIEKSYKTAEPEAQPEQTDDMPKQDIGK